MCLGMSACSLLPASLDSPIELEGRLALDHETKRFVEHADVLVSRCFLPRSIVPICELVPLAKYKTTDLNMFKVMVYMKGLYQIEINSCIDGKNYWASETIKIVTGKEQIENMLLRESFGGTCKNGI